MQSWIKIVDGAPVGMPTAKPTTVALPPVVDEIADEDGTIRDEVVQDAAVVGCAHWTAEDLRPFGWLPVEGDLADGQIITGVDYDAGTDTAHLVTAPAPPTNPSSIVLTAPQFFIALGQSGYITTAEALAAARDGTVPAAIDQVFQALPPAQALAARITWARMTQVPRFHPLVEAAASAIGVTQAQIDALFLAAREI